MNLLYSKWFDTHSEYEDYKNSKDYILPNVSICYNDLDVHYEKENEVPETRLVAKYDVLDTTNPTQIVGYESRTDSYATNCFTEIEIDGVVQERIPVNCLFDNPGEHIVKYTLADPSQIGYGAFSGCLNMVEVILPDSVTTISNQAFNNTGLKSVTIPTGIENIKTSAFYNISNLVVTCLPSVPPTLQGSSQFSTNGLIIYVPFNSLERYRNEWNKYFNFIYAIIS